jgi:O-antigen biosynthesis protein
MLFKGYTKEIKDLAEQILQGKIPLGPSHEKMISLVNPNTDVLEIGCANGFISSKLNAKGCKVTGVEIDPELSEKAKKFCSNVITGNIENESTLKSITGEYDYILFGDILEHLIDPFYIVNSLKEHLKNDGSIITSLPNIAIWWMRRDLALGKFVYHDTGLLDRTHLRFFTFCTINKFFDMSNLDITNLHVTSNDFPLKNRLKKLLPRFKDSIERFGERIASKRPNLFGFHFVIVAKKR